MKLISDGYGNYAIRRGFFSRQYFDFQSPGFWWGYDSQFIKHCWTNDKPFAEMWLKRLTR